MDQNPEPQNLISEVCLICYNSFPSSDFFYLECRHAFCQNCLFSGWHSKINSGFFDISSLKCPQYNCLKPISFEFLKTSLPNEQYSRLEDLCNSNSEVLHKNNEKAIKCPKCDIRYDIWKEADYFTCSLCKTEYCSKCFGDNQIHKGFSCDEYEKNKNESKEDISFLKMIKETGLKKCPNCQNFIEREGGCNFIRCKSNKCANNNICFCYLCGEKIDAKQHYTHYLVSPWEGPCIKMALEEKTSDLNNNEKLDEKENNLTLSCPECKIDDKKTCVVERNMDEKGNFCCCRSVKCNGKVYCLLCKKVVNDKNFNEHLKGDCINGINCIIF